MRKKPDQSFYDMPEVQSATECTGLMPAMPPTEEGAENLSQLMAIHCPPGAMPGGEEAKQWEREVAHPSDAHNRLRNTQPRRPSSAPAPSRPPQGRNQPGSAPSPAQER